MLRQGKPTNDTPQHIVSSGLQFDEKMENTKAGKVHFRLGGIVDQDVD
jgi:hypothetical protein